MKGIHALIAYGRRHALCLFAIMLSLLLTGCGEDVILSAGFSDIAVFEVEGEEFTLPEMRLYLINEQREYEKIYGADIWDEDPEMAVVMRENALARAVRVKTLCLMARQGEDENAVTLSEEELDKAARITSEYENSLTDEGREYLDITSEKLLSCVQDYLLAGKMYEEIIGSVNPEISDDEARTVRVESIFVAAPDEASQLSAIRKAELSLEALTDGEEFSAVAARYSDDPELYYNITRDEADPVVEDAAFNLSEGEVSDILEVDGGYRIIKCISSFDRDETDRNKTVILQERRQEAFETAYEAFTADLDYVLSEQNWAKCTVCTDPGVQAGGLFELCE